MHVSKPHHGHVANADIGGLRARLAAARLPETETALDPELRIDVPTSLGPSLEIPGYFVKDMQESFAGVLAAEQRARGITFVDHQ